MSRTGTNIYKRKDGRWEGRYIKGKAVSGKTQYGYVYVKTYKEAKIKLVEKAATVSHPSAATKNTNMFLFADMSQEWLKNIAILAKESTYNKYKNLLDAYILPVYERIPIEQISHESIDEYCQYLLRFGEKRGLDFLPKQLVTH